MKNFLIVGLGNIGKKYKKTRHNIGFLIIDKILKKYPPIYTKFIKYIGYISLIKLNKKKIFILKPYTYINISGNIILSSILEYNIYLENLLIIVDDLNLKLGYIRIKKKGSSGGHNGLKNIEKKLCTNIYPRLKFGIGENFFKKKDYVLENWKKEEILIIEEKLEKAANAAISFVLNGIEKTMNLFNNK
jgi:PTH1 family peptidyl-tRNA hydrolase